MSTLPTDSAFDVPEQPGDPRLLRPLHRAGNHQPVAGSSEGEQQSDTDVDWVNSELHTIASTIEELQGRLEQANTRLNTASRVESTEAEIGRLFLEAQKFSEASLSELGRKIQEILCEAEAKAEQILTEATQEALQIRHEAQQAAFASTRTAQELQTAISGFTVVNDQLLKELGQLNSMLTPAGERGIPQIEPLGQPESD